MSFVSTDFGRGGQRLPGDAARATRADAVVLVITYLIKVEIDLTTAVAQL